MGLVVFSAGSNAHGQLAQGSEEDSFSFRRCSFSGIGKEWLYGTKIVYVAAGANHTLVLIRSAEGDTQLWGCGDGRRGQLGLQTSGTFSVFQRIYFDHQGQYAGHEITAIAAAWETSYIVLSHLDGDVLLSSGSDDFGDLGVGGLAEGYTETRVWRPVSFQHVIPRNATSTRILQLKSGPHHVIVHLQYELGDEHKTDAFAGWGAARHGQLGRLPMEHSANMQTFPIKINLKPGICDFAIGNQHTVFLARDGLVSAFGSNKKKQTLGLTSMRGITEVRATWNSTYLVQKKEDSCGEGWAILATGSNPVGQLTLGSDPNNAALQHKVKFPDDVIGAKLLGIACGSEHILVMLRKSDQDEAITEVFGWGWNEHGNLGLGHNNNIQTPIKIWPDNSDCQVGKVVSIWGGCAASWIAVEFE